MTASNRIVPILKVAFIASLLGLLLPPFGLNPALAASSISYFVSPSGSDSNNGTSPSAPFRSIQKAVDLAQPGDTITLASGTYMQDVLSKRDGTAGAPITIKGPANAIVKGAGKARIFELNHDYITLDGFTIDGLAGSATTSSGYRDKLLYVLGKQTRSGVTGLRVLNMTFKNAGGECVRLRYFAQNNEIANSRFLSCGVHDFKFSTGGKNGEAIYIGTAPEQRADGKNPTVDIDQSNNNWVHHNTFDTQGNECVDIKEGASGNIVEANTCTGQKDPESAGFDSRGNGNIFRNNESYGNLGAGVRLGGDTASDGINNDVYQNTLRDNRAGGIKLQREKQGKICGNIMSGNTGGDATGSYGSLFKPTQSCETVTSGSTPVPTATQVPATATQVPATATPVPATATSAPATATATTGAEPVSCDGAYLIDGSATTLIEAEVYSNISGRFTQMADGNRSGGLYMNIPGKGTTEDPNTFLAYNINVSNGGKFYVWLLGYGPDGSSDSFFAQVDASSLVQATLTQGKWGWKRVGSTLSITSGGHQLLIKNREDGASVDKIVLTKDSNYVPSDLGGSAQVPCQ